MGRHARGRRGDGDGGAADRVLNQDEIDSLLGFDANAGSNVELTGVQALINSALVSYERLPMLEIVFDRLVRLATTSLRNFTSDNVEVTDGLDLVGALRRLPQFHPAAGHPLGHQGRGMGELRAAHRRLAP